MIFISDLGDMLTHALLDGPTLPASTYGEPRPSNVSLETEDGEERGFLPMAFDPTPLAGPPPIARKVIPRAQDLSPPEKVDARARDYFGKTVNKDARRQEQRPPTTRSMSTEQEHERSGSQARASPHIFYQDKGRQQRKTSETNTPVINSATTSPLTATLQEQSDRNKVQQPETGSLAPRANEGFKLQEAPKTRRTNSKTSPQLNSNPPVSPMDGSSKDIFPDRPVGQSPVSTDSPNSSVNPFEDPKRQENGPTSAAPTKQVDRPMRGDSLATSTRAAKASTPETQTPTMASTQVSNANDRNNSESSMPAAFVDAKTGLSRDNSHSKAIESPAMRTSFEAPPPRSSSRQNAANKTIAGEDFTAPRAPPPPPPATIERHRNNESISSYDPPLSPSLRSAGLPKASLDGAFSMEEEMARILRGDSVKQRSGEHPSPSVLRKVSNAVKHGRSFSDRAIHGKSTSNGAIEISSPLTISSPMLSSPNGKETNEALAAQLRRAQQRIAYLETEVLRMEEKVDSSTEIKAANNELKEKRSTIVVLDGQREMVVRELEAMTEHLAKAKDSNQPLDMNSMKGNILKDFGEALQRLKDQMSAQIEDLIQKRNLLTEEIGNLIQMKDKGFQEYEVLSNKNAQLLEMNNQILHNIQDMYKSNKSGSGSSANGLGIYHTSGRDDAGSMAEMRNLNVVNTDASMPNLLQEEAEPATVLTGPQVVNIRKGQPKKFNWRKGGEKMAKNVTKGLRGAFASDRMPGKDGESPYSIGMPYNQTHQAVGGSELSSLSGRPGLDGGKLGFFAQKPGGLKPGTLGNMNHNSSTNLVLDASGEFEATTSLVK